MSYIKLGSKNQYIVTNDNLRAVSCFQDKFFMVVLHYLDGTQLNLSFEEESDMIESNSKLCESLKAI